MDKKLVLLCVLFFIASTYKISERSMLWDEGGHHTTVGIFLVKLARHWISSPTLSVSELRGFALDFHSHYQVALAFLYQPPVTRVVTTISFLLLGITEFAARIPTVFFGLVLLISTYILSNDLFGDGRKSIVASLIAALSPRFFEYSRLAMIDVPVASMVALTSVLFLRYTRDPSFKNATLFGVVFGLAMLTKFPAVFIVIPFLVYILASRNLTILKSKYTIFSLFLSMFMAFLWFVAVTILQKALGIPSVFLKQYSIFLLEMQGSLNPLIWGVNIWTVLKILFTIVPIPFVLAGFVYALIKRSTQDVLLLSWIAVYFFVFTLIVFPYAAASSRYLLVCVPALSILMARFLVDMYDRYKSNMKIVMYSGAVILLAALLYNSNQQLMYTHDTFPMEDSAVYVLNNIKAGDGVIFTNMGLHFYFLKNDPHMKASLLGATEPDSITHILTNEFSDPENELMGIPTPKIKYIVTFETHKEPSYLMSSKVDYNSINNMLDGSAQFNLEKVFASKENPDEKVLVYRVMYITQ